MSSGSRYLATGSVVFHTSKQDAEQVAISLSKSDKFQMNPCEVSCTTNRSTCSSCILHLIHYTNLHFLTTDVTQSDTGPEMKEANNTVHNVSSTYVCVRGQFLSKHSEILPTEENAENKNT